MNEPPPFPEGTGERPPLTDQNYRQVIGSISALIQTVLAEFAASLRDFGMEAASREGATPEDHRRIAREAADVRNKLDAFVLMVDRRAGADADWEMHRRILGPEEPK